MKWLDSGSSVRSTLIEKSYLDHLDQTQLGFSVGLGVFTVQSLIMDQTEPKRATFSKIDRTLNHQARSLWKLCPVTENSDTSTPNFTKL